MFQWVSRFPCSTTCANTSEIPLSMNYEQFQKDMDFGIQNSPGFGLYWIDNWMKKTVMLALKSKVRIITCFFFLFFILLQISHVFQCYIKFHIGLPGHWLHLANLSLQILKMWLEMAISTWTVCCLSYEWTQFLQSNWKPTVSSTKSEWKHICNIRCSLDSTCFCMIFSKCNFLNICFDDILHYCYIL